jgi:hypothetical protein
MTINIKLSSLSLSLSIGLLTGTVIQTKLSNVRLHKEAGGVIGQLAVAANNLGNLVHVHSADISKSFYIVDMVGDNLVEYSNTHDI